MRLLDSDVVAGSIQPAVLGCMHLKSVSFLESRGVITDKQNLQVLHKFTVMTDTLLLAESEHDKIIDLSQGKKCYFL